MIPLLVPDLPDIAAILPYLERMYAKRWYSNNGPLVKELEARLSDLYAAPVVTVANATLGLELGLTALGLQPHSRVMVPAFTFVATHTAIRRAGHEPVIGDAVCRGAHDAVMPVCSYGFPQNGWSGHGRPVLIDAAPAFGNQSYYGVPLVFSLHATKALGAGEGGFVVGSKAFVSEIRRLANFGEPVGTNAKMSEYHAAVALAALDRWEEVKARRKALRARYAARLNIVAPEIPTLLGAVVPDAWVAEMALTSKGIGCRRWYVPETTLNTPNSLPFTQTARDRIIGIPFHHYLTDSDVDTVCDAVATLAGT